MPTVKVDATYEEKFEPDVIHVRVEMEGYGATRQEASDKYGRALDKLLDAIECTGISREDVKNTYLSIWQPWSKKKHKPFEYDAYQTFDIECTEECFDAVWDALMRLDDGEEGFASPRFSYALKDEEGARSKIVRHTVQIGRQRAEQLADAVGCDLGQIVSIKNGLDADRFYGKVCYGAASSGGAADSHAPVFNPDSIDIDCSVQLEYELVPRR